MTDKSSAVFGYIKRRIGKINGAYMEASRRERLVLFGVVPILATGFGAVATVLAQKYFGGGQQASQAVIAVLKMPGLSAADRIKLIDAVTRDSERFYDLLRFLLVAFAAPLAAVLVSFARR